MLSAGRAAKYRAPSETWPEIKTYVDVRVSVSKLAVSETALEEANLSAVDSGSSLNDPVPVPPRQPILYYAVFKDYDGAFHTHYRQISIWMS